MRNGDTITTVSTYTIQEDGRLLELHDGTLAAIVANRPPDNAKRPYTKRGLGDTSQKKHRFYHNARRRALTKLKERHEEEFEALFAEQLRRVRP